MILSPPGLLQSLLKGLPVPALAFLCSSLQRCQSNSAKIVSQRLFPYTMTFCCVQTKSPKPKALHHLSTTSPLPSLTYTLPIIILLHQPHGPPRCSPDTLGTPWLWVFALAIPFAWSALPPDIPTWLIPSPSALCSNFNLTMRFTLISPLSF